MGAFDQAARLAAANDPGALVRRVLRPILPALPLRFFELTDTRTLLKPEPSGGGDRTADLVAIVENEREPNERWLLFWEVQTEHEPDKLDTTLEEVARFRIRTRYGEPRVKKYRVLTALVYLKGICPDEPLDMSGGGFGTWHRPLIWNVGEDSAVETLAAFEADPNTWASLFWVPLMQGGGEPQIVERWVALVLERIKSGQQRGDLGRVVLIFSDVHPERRPIWHKALEGFDMTESPTLNEWVAEARQETRLEDARSHLIRVLDHRFPGFTSREVLETIRAQESLEILDIWFNKALSAFSAEEMLKEMRR